MTDRSDLREDSLNFHRKLKGKIEIHSKITQKDLFATPEQHSRLSLAYTPGVAYVAAELASQKELVYEYTSKWNNVAIVCDGTRVLGLGNVGPEAALPVMEGKSVLFKLLGGVDAYPLCVSTQDKEKIIQFVKMIEPVFAAINIEDIESPKVFEIVERLQNELSIPIFHDDQHGTGVVVLAALLNALRVVGKELDKIKVVMAGAGSAGYGIFGMLNCAGCKNLIILDSLGPICEGRSAQNRYKQRMARGTNPMGLRGTLDEMVKGADVFIGVSGKKGLLTKDMVKSMNTDAIVFALSNPEPEILPQDALEAGARIVATGRSDFINQVNNAIIFPSLFRAILDWRIRTIDLRMLTAVSHAIADLIDREHLNEDYIVPKMNDPGILPAFTVAIKKFALGNIRTSKEVQIR
jgi:malate dehydrogenase (oxaloacetate-decarboxylating)